MDLAPTSTHASNLATVLFELERFDEAEKALSRAIELDPAATHLRIRLAMALAYRSAYERAFAVLDDVTRVEPHNPAALSSAVAIFILKGDLTTAVERAADFVDRWPESALAYETLGWAHFKDSNANASVAAYDRAIVLEPGSARLTAARAAALSLAGRHHEALRAFESAADMGPGSIEQQPEWIERLHASRRAVEDR